MMNRFDESPYPLNQLQNARLDFVLRWNVAMNRDPVVRCLTAWHRHFPPTIRMKNCAEYLFSEENTASQMPRLPGNPSDGPTANKRRRLDPVCSHPSEKPRDSSNAVLFTTIIDDEDQSYQRKRPPVLKCDYCPFESTVESDAMSHLTESKHASCSRYVFVITGNGSEPTNDRIQLLRDPRVLCYVDVPEFNWVSGQLAVVCPDCFVVFPDKLMCAHHSTSQHDHRSPYYTYGTVLAVRQVTSASHLHCDACKRTFPTQFEYVEHWSSDCAHPFEPILAEPGQRSQQLIVEAYCHVCNRRFQHTNIQPTDLAQIRVKASSHHLKPGKQVSRLGHWCFAFGRFVFNHFCMHSRAMPNTKCRFSIRLIQTPKSGTPLILPAYQRKSDRDLLQFCIRECRRLIAYLETFKGVQRSLLRQSKNYLSTLLAQA